MPNNLQLSLKLAGEKGASSWLSTLPLECHGFALHKGGFCDALALRYGWSPKNLPVSCVCGRSNDIEHALSCPNGAFPTIRHNDIRDLTVELMSEVCHDVIIIIIIIIALWCKHTKGLLVTCTNSRESTLHYITYLPTYLLTYIHTYIQILQVVQV